MSVLVIGGANVDHVARSSAQVVAGTSNPGRATESAGGVARNVAENLARLGEVVTLLAPIADDRPGRWLREGLAESGVRLVALPADATGSYHAVLDADGELHVAVSAMEACEHLAPDDVPTSEFESAAWVVLDGNLPPPVVQRCLDLARSAGARVIVEPVSVAKANRLASLDLMTHTVTPNLAELHALTGRSEPEAAVAELHGRGVERVWLRRGALGSTLFEDRLAHDLPSRQGPVVDVTGAGDAMLAAYVHRLIAGDVPSVACEYAAVAAQLTVAVAGAVRTDLTAELLEESR